MKNVCKGCAAEDLHRIADELAIEREIHPNHHSTEEYRIGEELAVKLVNVDECVECGADSQD